MDLGIPTLYTNGEDFRFFKHILQLIYFTFYISKSLTFNSKIQSNFKLLQSIF